MRSPPSQQSDSPAKKAKKQSAVQLARTQVQRAAEEGLATSVCGWVVQTTVEGGQAQGRGDWHIFTGGLSLSRNLNLRAAAHESQTDK